MAAEDLEVLLVERDLAIARVEANTSAGIRKDLSALEMAILDVLKSVDPSEPTRRGDQFNRVTKVGAEIQVLTRGFYRNLNARFGTLQAGLIADESARVVAMSQESGLDMRRTVSQKAARQMVDQRRVLIDGAPARAHWNRQERHMVENVTTTLRRQVVADASLTQMVRSLRGEQALGFSNGMMRTYERFAKTTSMTGIQAATNISRFETYQANSDTVKMVQAINPLDSKTSPICQARAGRVWSMGDGRPLGHGVERFPGPPPWHLGCRTTILPLGRRDTPVRGQTFGGLLDSMPENRQKAMLGPGKFELWRNGDISMSDMIDQSGRPLTLNQLRERST